MRNEDQIAQTLVTIRDYIRYAMSRFTESKLYFGHGTDNAWDEAVHLIFFLLKLPESADQRLLDAKLTPDERKLIVRMIEQRCADRVPLPYITGSADFAGLGFNVDERVLIPRSPLAELIERQFSPWLSEPPKNVLDLCTGSGCIGIACAAYWECLITLSDLSSDALEVARTNLKRHALSEVATLVQSDLFDSIEGEFDLIVSNPPYVDEEDFQSMPAEYRHEPAAALIAGHDGLDLARRILAEASQYLRPNGHLVMELGNSWVHLEQAYPNVPWTWIEFERGGHGVLIISREELQQYF